MKPNAPTDRFTCANLGANLSILEIAAKDAFFIQPSSSFEHEGFVRGTDMNSEYDRTKMRNFKLIKRGIFQSWES